MKTIDLSASLVRSWLPPRPADSHKGLNGHVLVVAGSRGMSGAAALTALGALRAGAGLVTTAIVQSERSAVTTGVPEALTLSLPETAGGLIGRGAYQALDFYRRERRINAVAVGPGLSVHPSLRNLIAHLLRKWPGPFVLDADGLNNLKLEDLLKSRHPRAPQPGIHAWIPRQGPRGMTSQWNSSLVVTPHVGEFARLARVDKEAVKRRGQELAEALARRLKCVCVLKGHRTLITDGVRSYRNTTGNPAMAAGGMGDVLTGAVASLLGQGVAPIEAAAAAVFLHGLAGDLARVSDRGLLATDLAAALPLALKKIGIQ